MTLQRGPKKSTDRRIIFDDEDERTVCRCCRHGTTSAASIGTTGCGRSKGSENRNDEPLDELFSAQTRPPCALTMPSQIVSPRPIPVLLPVGRAARPR